MGRHMALMATTRRFSFRGTHSINDGVYRERRHGHQFFLEISFHGCSLIEVEHEITARILKPLDGHDLNQVVEPATGEMVVEWIQSQIDGSNLRGKILGVILQETAKNRFVSAHTDVRLV